MTEQQLRILARACACEPGKGFLYHGSGYSWRSIQSLVSKGMLWTIDAPIRIVIATDKGRATRASVGGES